MNTFDDEFLRIVRTMKRQSHFRKIKILSPLNKQYNLIIDDGLIYFVLPPSEPGQEMKLNFWLDIDEDIFSIAPTNDFIYILCHNSLLLFYDLNTLKLYSWNPQEDYYYFELGKWIGQKERVTNCLKFLRNIRTISILKKH